MQDSRTNPGHEQARALAHAIASLRANPPTGLEVLATLPWTGLHSISWRSDKNDPLIVVETMQLRSRNGTRSRTCASLPPLHPASEALRSATGAVRDIVGDPDAIVCVKVMIAYLGWEVSVEPAATDAAESPTELPCWSADETLTLTGAEWTDFIVHRDADEHEGGLFAAHALLRTAMMIEEKVKDDEEGYRKHWTRVDAEILRRIAIRENPALDPGFRSGLRLVA